MMFKQTLPFSGSLTQLLQQFTPCTGLIYLYDQHQPCIGVLPESYWQVKGQTAEYVQRLDDFSYQTVRSCSVQQVDSEIQHWLKIDPNHTTTLAGFHGGYLGFVSYDDGAETFVTVQKRPQIGRFIGHYPSFIRVEDGQFVFYSDEPLAESLYQYLLTLLSKHSSPALLSLSAPYQARWSKADYDSAFQRVQDYIIAGDCYQINLTQEFTAQATGDLLSIAERLWHRTQAPFSGYVRLADFELLSCSPELFIEWYTATQIKTRPIKGTMPRHHNPMIDEQYRQTLATSQKDQAENVMIVDLLRNDFSHYAEIGSVKTLKLFEVESFNQVHHLVSEIHATLKPEIHPWQMLMQALPGGSITGAPKIRAMQIIEELEQGARGVYCGSLGYFNTNGTGRWNILIRTIQKQNQQLSVWAGGGITIASNVDAEYQECFDKVAVLLEELNQQYA